MAAAEGLGEGAIQKPKREKKKKEEEALLAKAPSPSSALFAFRARRLGRLHLLT